MTSEELLGRYEWSKLNHLQVGRYAEHLATMRFIDDTGEIDSDIIYSAIKE